MGKDPANEPTLEQQLGELTGDDVRAAARRAVTFLAACVDGEIAEVTTSERIMAAQALLMHAARLPDLLGEVASLAELASEDDVALIVTALE